MFNNEALFNFVLLIIAYAYVLLVIFVTGKLRKYKLFAPYSRKFLHIMIGNLVFLIPLFSFNSFPLNFPFFVAAPFILITFLASSFSPLKIISQKMRALSEITDRGHQTGLICYSLSYTALAALFSSQPYLIAAGVLPMSYGDAFASIVGQKFGKKCYKIFSKKSIEGSIAMFVGTLIFVSISFMFMTVFSVFPETNILLVVVAVATIATVAEAVTPLGLDNITVPALSVLVTLAITGGL